MSLKNYACLLVLTPLSGGLLLGCTDTSSNDRPVAAPSAQTDAAPTTQQGLNRAKLGAAPVVVQSKFIAEHPGVAVTNVAVQPAENGIILYKVTYIDAGTPKSVTYNEAGEQFARPSATQPAGAATTQPTTQP